ncbi:MAG TPA: DNA polymerase domain-containing protein [Roseiflexaceae bacterium]|nr:DNA polymerase domain-containing protein [Roseiflexaceae bacterium]
MPESQPTILNDDTLLFGWNLTPGIVSVWADRAGQAFVWQRSGGALTRTVERYRPWLLATTLDDLAHVRGALQPTDDAATATAPFAYQALDGPDGWFRFLLSARDGRLLERTILQGAARRRERRVTWNELDDNYYRVGPVEQYLMQTGQVYFRDLVYADLHRLQFDLETTALDPQRGRIFLIAVRDSQGFATVLEAPHADDEPRVIAELCALIRERDPDVIENHNLFGFDLPFLVQRAAVHGLPLELGRAGAPRALMSRTERVGGFRRRQQERYSVAGRELLDTLDAVRRHDFVVRDLASHRLKDVARAFGLASEERVYLAGAEVAATYARDPDAVRRYALDDVSEVDGLSQRLLGAPFALAGMAPRRFERVASAGPAMGILEPMLVRAYLRAGKALPCQAVMGGQPDDPHAGGGLHLFATGVAQHVVKADVASLYPSIMKTYQIGSGCDSLGALLGIVSRLTDLRLQHKAAARTAQPGSAPANHHHALQAAMKLLINSAYGYMGAGSMAMFADRRAADAVTSKGREILGQVVAALQERGMACIEADTDGVYFAVPPHWQEADEQALVADVAALLPQGIRLEYEGRYQAMFSHEVKNYALLTYAGDVIVRGVALRSSRSEPFGERFLREALRCLLHGNVDELQRVYHATISMLEARGCTAADVATRVRLTKAPDAYMAARPRHPEPQYEALLNAGRATWQPGERVRFYRTADGAYVWLPDETDDTAFMEEAEPLDEGADAPPASASHAVKRDEARDYDIAHYVNVLHTSYVSRLRKAFAPEHFDQLFRHDGQLGLFDTPVAHIEPRWIRCAGENA